MVLKRVISFITFILLFAGVYSSVQLQAPDMMGYKKATLFDKILCYLNLQECKNVLEIHIYKFLGAERQGNNIIFRFKAKPIEKTYVKKYTVFSTISLDMYPLYVNTDSDFISSLIDDNGVHRIIFQYKCLDCYSSDLYPSKLKFTFGAYNNESTDKELSLIKIWFKDLLGYTTNSYIYEIELDQPYVWKAYTHLSYWIYFDIDPKILARSIEANLYDLGSGLLKLYAIEFISSAHQDIAICSLNSAENFNCNVNSDYIINIQYLGYSIRVFKAYYYNVGSGIAVLAGSLHVFFAGDDPSVCESFRVAFKEPNEPYPASEVGECYECPPHSHNPNVIITSGIPYCVCDSGYENRDNPVNGDTSKTYITDSNGCEYQPPPADCSVAVWMEPSSKTVAPGEQASFTVYIKNQGNTQCTYSLSKDCGGTSCSLSKTSITLNAGETGTATLTASSNTEGTYTLKVTASSTSPVTGYSDTATATLRVQKQYSCSVDLSVDSQTKTIEVGGQTQYIITVKNTGNTLCTYTLSKECPSQVTCTLSTTTVTLNQGQSTTVTLTASSNTEGEYTLKVTATAQQYGGSDTITMTLKVIAGANPPDVSLSPTSITMYVNETKTISVYVKNTGKQQTTYNLTVSCPSGLSCTLSKTSVTVDPGKTTTIYLYIKGISKGEYLVTVTAKGPRGEEDTASAYVIVKTKEEEQPSLTPTKKEAIPSISVTPTSLDIDEGGTGSVFITVKNIGEAPGTFTISATCPTGITCTLSQTQVTLSSGQQAIITLTIQGNTAGNYTVTITVKDGQTATATVYVRVKEAGLQSVIPWEYVPWLILIVILIILLIWRLT